MWSERRGQMRLFLILPIIGLGMRYAGRPQLSDLSIHPLTLEKIHSFVDASGGSCEAVKDCQRSRGQRGGHLRKDETMKSGFVVCGAILYASTAWAVLSNTQKCASAYLQAGGTHIKCIFQARDKAQKAHVAPDYSRCEKTFATAWNRAQALWGSSCPANLWTGSTGRFVDNGDGTITDNLTGLMWEEKTNKDGMRNPADPHDADNKYSFSSSLLGNPDGTAYTDLLATLNAANFAGHNDWRLPSLVELQTILASPSKCSVGPPCVDDVFNSGTNSETLSGYYWSSTLFAPSPGFAWFVSFSSGDANLSSATFEYAVRAVRGGF
jgi:hypothetical protein